MIQLFDAFRRFLKEHLPEQFYIYLQRVWRKLIVIRYRLFGRPSVPKETSKARYRRIKEGFFERFCKGRGLDIGHGGDILSANCQGWDLEQGDAQYLRGIENETFDFVYSSHLLEHMVHPDVALKNWWRPVKKGGYLILYIPHRDLYEKKQTLPSRWNVDHKHFFLLDRDEKPDTLGIIPLIKRSLENFELVYAQICDQGHTITDPLIHSDGEISIEVVLQKKS